MPKVEAGETKEHYISRCIPYVMKEGTAKDDKQAAAVCYSLWNKHAEKDVKASLVCSVSNPTEKLPSNRFRKIIAKAGTYKGRNGEFTIDAAEINRLANVSNEMFAKGIKIPMPLNHPVDLNNVQAEKNMSFIDKIEAKGNDLIAEWEAHGADAIAASLRNDVSIYRPLEWADGTGRVWDRPLRHVALTPNPLMPNLGEAVIVASLEVSIKHVEEENAATTDEKKAEAEEKKADEANETPEEAQEVETDEAEEKTAEAAEENKEVKKDEEEVKEEIDPQDTDIGKIKAELGLGEEHTVEHVIQAIRKLNGARAEVVASMPSAREKELMKKLLEVKLDGLVRSQAITPAVRTKLINNSKTIVASNMDAGVEQIVDILAENKLIDVETKSLPQVGVLDQVTAYQTNALLEWVEKQNKAKAEALANKSK